jgi:mannose-6-phosphate isomerase-like protein (cupin superfamily)
VLSYKMALASLASDERYSEVLSESDVRAGIYAPHESDDPKTHDVDQLYVVLNGSGFFVVDEERNPFGPGDLLYAPAGSSQFFEQFTPDFAVWEILCGPASE